MTSENQEEKRGIAVFYELFEGRDPDDESDIVDADDRGLEEFIGTKGVDEAIEHIRNAGCETSSSEFHEGMWYTSADSTINIRTGDRTNYSYHLKGFSEDEQRIIHNGWKSESWNDLDASYVVGQLADIERDYEISNGRIVSPGKFENSPVMIAYLNSCDDWSPLESVDVDGIEMSLFKITQEERVLMQIPEDQKYVVAWETDDGFVHGRTMTEEEYTAFPKQSLSAIGGM